MIAKVLVQTPISAIEEIYDYKIPDSLKDQLVFGQLVEIPFRTRLTIGLVIDIDTSKSAIDSSNSSTFTKLSAQSLKEIKRILNTHPVIDVYTLNLIKAVQKRFGGSLWQILGQALPNVAQRLRIDSEVKAVISQEVDEAVRNTLLNQIGASDFKQLESTARMNWAVIPPNGTSTLEFIANVTAVRALLDQVLILVPDEKELLALEKILFPIFKNELVIINSSLSRTERFINHLRVIKRNARVILGTRAAALAPVSSTATVIVYDELDESFWEKHSPGWNVRDVTLLRKQNSSIFISTSFSLDLMNSVDDGCLQFRNYGSLKRIKWLSSDSNRSYHEVVKDGLKTGPVLISIAEKGYANMFICSKCRNPAKCDCGGKLTIPNPKSNPTCSLCSKEFRDWKCTFCLGTKPFVLRKGADRTLEEIGKIFPKIPIVLSTGSKRLDMISKKPQIVIATPGAEPIAQYSALVLLDGELVFNRPQLRAEEIARLRWRKNIWHTDSNGAIFLSLSNHHNFVQDLFSGNEKRYFAREIATRRSAKMPPEFRTATISGAGKDLAVFAANLRNLNKYLVSDVRTDNDANKVADNSDSTVIVRFDRSESDSAIKLFNEINQVRLLKKKSAFSVMIDSYNLF